MTAVVEPVAIPLVDIAVKPASAADIAEAAADYMDEHGWCRHNTRDAGGRVCARGALWGVMFGYDGDLDDEPLERWAELDAISMVLTHAAPLPASAGALAVATGGLVAFNDFGATRRREVTAYFRRAAKSLRAQES